MYYICTYNNIQGDNNADSFLAENFGDIGKFGDIDTYSDIKILKSRRFFPAISADFAKLGRCHRPGDIGLSFIIIEFRDTLNVTTEFDTIFNAFHTMSLPTI